MSSQLPIFLVYKSMQELSQRIKNEQKFKELKIDANFILQNKVPQNTIKTKNNLFMHYLFCIIYI